MAFVKHSDSNLLAETTPARESDTTNAWTDLMQLERHDIESTHDAHDVTYASDLFTLSYILRHKWDQRAGATLGLTRREHFPGPAGMNALLRSTSTPANKQDIAEAQYLADMGCFVLPPKHVLDNMISAYFQYFHPNYPIIARATFMHKYVNVLSGSIPLLLLWGMLYVGCTLCSSEDIEHAGFANRFEALRSFAKRGKALYNAKYERDKILVIIFEFLISQVSSDGEVGVNSLQRVSVLKSMHQTRTAICGLLVHRVQLNRSVCTSPPSHQKSLKKIGNIGGECGGQCIFGIGILQLAQDARIASMTILLTLRCLSGKTSRDRRSTKCFLHRCSWRISVSICLNKSCEILYSSQSRR